MNKNLLKINMMIFVLFIYYLYLLHGLSLTYSTKLQVGQGREKRVQFDLYIHAQLINEYRLDNFGRGIHSLPKTIACVANFVLHGHL